jgi:hypothetical protein
MDPYAAPPMDPYAAGYPPAPQGGYAPPPMDPYAAPPMDPHAGGYPPPPDPQGYAPPADPQGGYPPPQQPFEPSAGPFVPPPQPDASVGPFVPPQPEASAGPFVPPQPEQSAGPFAAPALATPQAGTFAAEASVGPFPATQLAPHVGEGQPDATPASGTAPLAGFLYSFQNTPRGEASFIYEGDNLVGRHHEICSVVVKHVTTSLRHAMLHAAAGKLYLTCLGGTNGTFLNGERLQPHVTTEVTDGDTLRFGAFMCHVAMAKHRPG